MSFNYEQTTSETCLPVCLLSLLDKSFTSKEEMDLFIDGIKRIKDSYAVSMVDAFVEKYQARAEIFVDNFYFWKYLKEYPLTSGLILTQSIISNAFIDVQPAPYILYIDYYVFTSIVHSPHFIVILENASDSFLIFDPWIGKTRKVAKTNVYQAVESLRNYLKYCPLLIKV